MEIDTYNTTAVSIHTITSLSLSLSVSNSTHTQSFCQALGRPPTEKLTINSANRISLAPPPFLLNLSCCAGHGEEKKEEITFDKCTLTNRTNTQQR